MQRLTMWRRQFNWRMLLIRVIVNALALLITVGLTPIRFVDRSVRTWLLLAIFLGILNALVKPIIQFLTLRFIFATYGLVVALINAILLLLLEFFFPTRFAIDGVILWPLVGGAILGIVSAVLENLLGLTPPIVSEQYPELRQKIKDRQTGSLEAHITQTVVERASPVHPVEQQSASPAATATAVLAVVGAVDGQPSIQPEAASLSPAQPAGASSATPADQLDIAQQPAEQKA